LKKLPIDKLVEYANICPVSIYFSQDRRARDLYRFQIPSSDWIPRSDAVENPGTFLPVPKTEIDNNLDIK